MLFSSFPVATVAASAVRKALRKEELKRMQKDLCLKLCSVCIHMSYVSADPVLLGLEVLLRLKRWLTSGREAAT